MRELVHHEEVVVRRVAQELEREKERPLAGVLGDPPVGGVATDQKDGVQIVLAQQPSVPEVILSLAQEHSCATLGCTDPMGQLRGPQGGVAPSAPVSPGAVVDVEDCGEARFVLTVQAVTRPSASEIRASLCHALAVVKISIRSGWHNVVPGRSWQPNFTPGAANRHSLMLALIPVCGTRQSGFVERPPPRWQPTQIAGGGGNSVVRLAGSR